MHSNKMIESIDLSSEAIDALRDYAIHLEKTNPRIAYEIMSLASQARPKGELIYNKLFDLSCKVQRDSQRQAINKLVNGIKKGDIAVVPSGFRCYTSTRSKPFSE